MIIKDAFTDGNPLFREESDYVDCSEQEFAEMRKRDAFSHYTSVPENNQGQGFEHLVGLKSFEIEFLLRRAPRRR